MARLAGELTLDDLRLFARIVALGTLSAAARECEVPVSKVSRALERIEKSCGHRLLRRSTHGLSLTPEGGVFLGYCQRIEAAAQDLEGGLSRNPAEPAGLVRISASTVVAQCWVVPAMAALSRRHSALRLDLVVDDRRVDLVREGIDIAVRTGALLNETWAARPLGRIDTGLFASPGYLSTAGTPLSVGDLAGHRLIANGGHPVLNDWRFEAGDGEAETLVADGPLRSDNTAIILAMAAQGLGIAQLPLAAAGPLVEQRRLQPVLAGRFQSAQVPVSALMLPEREQSPKLRAVVDQLLLAFG
jgi:DNA-binding transcriptional LysR family regulator